MLTNLLVFSQRTQDIIKAILIIFLVVILVFALFGFIGSLIEKTMKAQGKKVDFYMTNVVISRICDKPKEFVRIARKKNNICFFKASITPIIFMLISFIIWLSYHLSIGAWDQSIFDTKTGILSLFYVWDFSAVKYVPPLGFDNITIANYPHFLADETMTNYFIFLFLFSGLIWYLINVQAYCSRLYRINYLKKTIYSKDLSQIDITHFYNLDKVNPYADELDQNKKTTDVSNQTTSNSPNNQNSNSNNPYDPKH